VLTKRTHNGSLLGPHLGKTERYNRRGYTLSEVSWFLKNPVTIASFHPYTTHQLKLGEVAESEPKRQASPRSRQS
jgi:hypothetical protein